MKFINKKRIASATLAGALALSMMTPAFAAEKNTTNISGTYTPITLAVTVPSTGRAIINPYGLPYTIGENLSISGQQITTGAPLTVQNRSSVALDVSAKLTGEVPAGSGFTFNATAPTDTETDKKAQVVFQMFPAMAITEATLEDTDILMGGFANLKDEDALPSTPVAVISTTPSDVSNILTLREGNSSSELQKGGAAYFRLSGKVAKKADWQSTDTFSVKVAFTFTPSTFVKDAGSLAATGSSNLGSIGTAPVTIKLTPGADLPADFTFTAANTVWELTGANVAKFKLTPDTAAPDTCKLVANTTDGPSTGDKVTVKVTVTDADGIPYTTEVECTAA